MFRSKTNKGSYIRTTKNPPPGQYDIWVGSYRAGQRLRANLIVTERARPPR